MFCFCVVLFLIRRSSADYLSDVKASLQKIQDYLSEMTEQARQSEPIKKIGAKVTALRKAIPISYKKMIFKHDYDTQMAQVHSGDQLSQGEQNYLRNRKPKIYSALKALFNEPIDEHNLPTISIICSGGGYRAMLGTIGFLSGIEKIGLLDAVTYVAALSGSTWALFPWIATGMSLIEFREYITQAITRDINDTTVIESNMISAMLFKKIVGLSPVTAVDIFGALLANRLLSFFGDQRQRIRLSDLTDKVETGNWPYPIGTAIDARSAVALDAPWFEFTPHEIGCDSFGAYIPSWAYGRKFNQGRSTSFRPEVNLGFQLGTYGSAFGVHIGLAWQTIEKTITNVAFKNFMEKLVNKYEGKRFFWADVYNFMAGLAGNPFKDRRYLKLVDAGLAFNLPYPSVSGERSARKSSDVLIFCNMSASKVKRALMKCEEYARVRNLPFPVIDYDGISKRTVSIFKDESDRSIPVVIYLPRFSDHVLWNEKKDDLSYSDYSSLEGFDIGSCVKSGFCKTTRFTYTKEQSGKVIDQMEFNVVVNREEIIDAIRWVVERE